MIDGNHDQLSARSLRAAIRRRLGHPAKARADIQSVLVLDPLEAAALDQRRRLALGGEWPEDLEVWSGSPGGGPLPGGVQTALDIAHDYAAAGLLNEAIDVLRQLLPANPEGSVHPMVRYTLAWLLNRAGDPAADAEFRRAANMPPDYCFPARLEEIEILQTAMALQPEDARAPTT